MPDRTVEVELLNALGAHESSTTVTVRDDQWPHRVTQGRACYELWRAPSKVWRRAQYRQVP